MHADITGLHRVGLLGRDPERLARRYRDLGFTLAAVPAGPHHAARVSARVGAASLDLLGVAAGPRPEVRRTGPRAEGLRLLDLGTGDAAKARRRLTEMGLRACADPRDGAARARVLRIDPRQTPEASLGVAQVARRPVHADGPGPATRTARAASPRSWSSPRTRSCPASSTATGDCWTVNRCARAR
ncbi:VOC family protein [Nocardia thailandica]